ncbi:putative MATE family efflux protein [Aequitasia blattaphilus]|uniref:Probable multidrug resistance protein NorM n=1 Tax=Aequitasia blattaphilus TaxID=2949332 RepID=A0ABT1EDF3_9FIRM|nr:MATE family efflux transporter [Aequitasia blattaphilus]MCP1103676.1 MATE family efflux transporter [Aequitasia blattaphilus]MCR8616316.1 MATE family efflux transporter [Aequitasia blattaphilus]
METKTKFIRNPFFKSFFQIAFFIIIQNMITYSVNVADNIMLGSYSQTALSGAATVNQIQFLLQQVTLGLGEGLVVLASQAWGKKDIKPIRIFTTIALSIGITVGLLLTIAASLFPGNLLRIFTPDPVIIDAGTQYLWLMRFTYLPFIISNILIASLRSMERVRIGFSISCVSLLVNISLNYIFIFGHFGAPKLGIVGAAIGTLSARILELIIVIIYIRKVQKGVFSFIPSEIKRASVVSYGKTSLPIVITQALFGLSITLQTVVLGHLSSDAIAANSAATTIFQYLKLIAIGSSSATVVVVGKSIGAGDTENLKKYKKTLQFIYLFVGLFICLCLNLVKGPLISMYSLNSEARGLALSIITLLSITSIGTSYQMPVNTGIIRGSGDPKFALKVDLVCIWCIMYPLSFLAAFIWKLPVIIVIAFLNSDQVFKCIPAFIKVNFFYKIKNTQSS